jgi:hypothetical protein
MRGALHLVRLVLPGGREDDIEAPRERLDVSAAAVRTGKQKAACPCHPTDAMLVGMHSPDTQYRKRFRIARGSAMLDHLAIPR